MTNPANGVLLDTHTLIWVVSGAPLRPQARDVIASAAGGRSLWISVVTAWELGLLFRQDRLGRYNPMGLDASRWFDESLGITRGQIDMTDVGVAFAAWALPEPIHKDPADRLLIATARARDFTIVTRDRAILRYAAAGHVRAVAC